MQTFTIEHTPAEIVNAFPKASDLFKANDINFCCEGDRPLRTVLKEKNIGGVALLEELNAGYEKWRAEDNEVINWEEKNLSDIVKYIDENYHTVLYEELFSLDPFVTRVYHRHGGDQPHLVEMYNTYNELKDNVEEHLINEEQDWFPYIQKYEEQPNEALLQQLKEINLRIEEEHKAQVDILNEIRVITSDFTPPAHACNTYRITYARLTDLYETMIKNIHMENNVLMKRLQTLSA